MSCLLPDSCVPQKKRTKLLHGPLSSPSGALLGRNWRPEHFVAQALDYSAAQGIVPDVAEMSISGAQDGEDDYNTKQ